MLDLELLVHGVGGATPQGMLNDPRVVRVSGDNTAALYRRADDAHAERHPGRHRDEPVPEAYCWSNLTSGDGRRALWLLLVPFMIVNLAHWMRPPHGGTRLNWCYDALLRLLALTLTALLVAGACEVAMDLLAWQCAGEPDCAGGKSWLVFAGTAQHGWWSEPGRRLVLGAVAPVGLVAGLWWLSRHTWWAYEAVPPTGTGAGAGHGGPLARKGFWYGRREVARLRAAHTTVGLLIVAAVLWTPAFRRDRAGGGAVPPAFGWVLAGALGVLAATVVVLTLLAGRDEDQAETGTEAESEAGRKSAARDRRRHAALYACALAALAGSLVFAAWHRTGWESSGRRLLPSLALCGLTLAQAVLVAALGAVVPLMVWTAGEAKARMAMRGLGGPAVALLACALGALFTSGAAQRMADWLDRGGDGTQDGLIQGPPVLLTWQASVLPGVIAVLLSAVATGAVLVRWDSRRFTARVEKDYPQPYDTGRTRHIARAQAIAALTDRGPVLLTTMVIAATVLGGGALAGAWITDDAPGTVAEAADPWIHTVAKGAQVTGSWLLGAAVVALVTLGRRAYRSAPARRTVGILWDVGTFWPRAAHPFAPPCYAERAVPDLSWRMTQWTAGHPGNRIVVSGHSQGSVLAAAAAWQLPPQTRDRVAVLTFGSPLARLYGRWFPAFFGPKQLQDFHGDVRAWCNLWRRTDPIGGEVGVTGGPAVDVRLMDPLAYRRNSEHPLIAPVMGHSHYPHDPQFAEARARVLAALTQPAASVPAQASPGMSSG